MEISQIPDDKVTIIMSREEAEWLWHYTNKAGHVSWLDYAEDRKIQDKEYFDFELWHGRDILEWEIDKEEG